jgi:Flp pilus assembly protein TadG
MLRRRKRSDQGAAAIEFALVLPLFVLLTFSIIDFGWYFFVEHTLQYATREGMRLALVGGRLKDKDNNDMPRLDSIIKKIKDAASLAVDPSGLTVYVYEVTTDDYTDPDKWDEQAPSAGNPGSYMRVKTRYTYHFLTPLIGAFFADGVNTIEAQGTYRNEQFDT